MQPQTPNKNRLPKPSEDHEGNQFDSIQAMCDYWGVTRNAFAKRIRLGWSLKEALTEKNKQPIKDHLGNEFNTQKEMCKHYNISPTTFYQRIYKHGWSLEEALTIAIHGKIQDHLGNTFHSIEEMCVYYNISLQTFNDRRKKGWSIKKTLTEPTTHTNRNHKNHKDHLGNEFSSIKKMCKYWHIYPKLYNTRRQKNWSIEKALTEPTTKIIQDHLGNEFRSTAAMCSHYGIDTDTFNNRMKKGWSIEKALTKKPKNTKNLPAVDPLGNKFQSAKQMCEHYKADYKLYHHHITTGYTVAEALKIIPIIGPRLFEKRLDDHLYVYKPIPDKLNGKAFYFKCSFDDNETVMTRNEIIEHLLSELKKEEQDATTNHKKDQDHASCRPQRKPVQFHAGNV